MRFSFLYLNNFRNYRKLQLQIPEGASLFIGNNAQGKTNLLEACYYVSSLNSPRSEKEADLAYWGESFFTVGARLEDDGTANTVEIQTQVIPSVRRRIRLNDRPAKRQELLRVCPCVYFSPDDLYIVKGSSSVRRSFMDSLLSRQDPLYSRQLSRYNSTVSRRNMALKRANQEPSWAKSLDSIDDLLVNIGSEIIHKRFLLTEKLDEMVKASYKFMSMDGCEIDYVSTIGEVPDGIDSIREQFSVRLKSASKEERARGITLIGPHRDEMLLSFDGKTFRYFGSQGQQRSVVLGLKMAEARILEGTFNTKPALLLDDVLSELDSDRRTKVISLCDLGYQILMTSTETAGVEESRFSKFIVEKGTVCPKLP